MASTYGLYTLVHYFRIQTSSVRSQLNLLGLGKLLFTDPKQFPLSSYPILYSLSEQYSSKQPIMGASALLQTFTKQQSLSYWCNHTMSVQC